ncbi:MAG: PAS domain S-box protein, partial [Phycisphaerae bacterium]
LFDRAPDAILVVGPDGRYLDANAAACRLTGYDRSEILTMYVGDLSVPAERDYSAERFELLRRTGRTRADRVVQRKDGTRITVEAHATALGDGRFQTTLRDVSERVATHRKLEESLVAYSTLVDLCNAAVISAGADGRIRSWNRGAEELFGYYCDEATGMPLVRLIPPSTRDRHLAGFALRLSAHHRTPFAQTLQEVGLRKNGSLVPVEISVGVGWQENELVATAVIRDVTEQRELVDRLNDALQKLQFQFERMPLAYMVWTPDFEVVEWNPAAERLFGYTKKEAIGRHAYDLIVPPEAIPAVDVTWADLLRGDKSSHSINANRRKDGSMLTCEWFNAPLLDSTGQVRGVASMTMDVTEREALESRIRDTQKLESLGVLAAGVAHDFNSSLMVILGNTALLRSVKRLPKKALEFVGVIDEAGSRADALVKHLLAYARTGRHNPQTTNLNTVIDDGLKLVRSTVGRRHDVIVNLQETPSPVVVDQSQVEQVILNLCLNAKEAMPDGGAIRLGTGEAELTDNDVSRCVPYDARPGRYAELVVADTGCGMDENTIQRMFDPFFSTKTAGHGLGMAAVLGIIRRHNGAIRVDSTPGRGTTFHVYFPVHSK